MDTHLTLRFLLLLFSGYILLLLLSGNILLLLLRKLLLHVATASPATSWSEIIWIGRLLRGPIQLI